MSNTFDINENIDFLFWDLKNVVSVVFISYKIALSEIVYFKISYVGEGSYITKSFLRKQGVST